MSEPIEPCPNCGSRCVPRQPQSPWSAKWVECANKSCLYRGPISLIMDDKRDGAIALHNRIARAVREAADWRQRAEAAEAEVERLRELRPKLTKPARVGAGTFRAGVAADLVVQAAQRLYEYEGERAAMTPEQRAAEDERLAQIVALFVNGLPARPADGGAE